MLIRLIVSVWWRRQGHTFDERARSQQLRHKSTRSQRSGKSRTTEKPLLVQALRNSSHRPRASAVHASLATIMADISEGDDKEERGENGDLEQTALLDSLEHLEVDAHDQQQS